MASKKDFRDRNDYPVGTWVSLELKSELYKMAHRENTSMSELVRRLLEKAVSEYKEDDTNGNKEE